MVGPSKLLLSLEAARGLYEFGLGWALNIPLQHISPRGDGHPVMVIPGLAGSDGSTQYIRNFLDGLGYDSYSWGLGRNLGPRDGIDRLLDKLSERLYSIINESKYKEVSIIGWSLGGIYGRELAKKNPDIVRQVITLGTPFKSMPDSTGTNVEKLYEILSRDKSHKDPEIIRKINEPPPVPFTSLYSKTDGIVHWECSLEIEGPHSQNIEVPGASHLGLGHNPISMYVIADRLTQLKENWKLYETK